MVGDDRGSLIFGNAGANRIHAGGGDDAVQGGAGADWIDGGAGDDWLDGGLGDDTVYGGGGDDVFVFGLHESGDMIFDHEGRNTLRIPGADPTKLQLGMQGDDLLVTHDGKLLATVGDYQAEHFAGIDIGQGVRSKSDFMAEPASASARALGEESDWLADYVPDAAQTVEPLPEPWSGLEADWAASAIADEATAASRLPAPADAVEPTFQPNIALEATHAAADLWLPMDDLPPLAPDPARDAAERHDGERHAAG